MEQAGSVFEKIPKEFWEIIHRAKSYHPNYLPLFEAMDETNIIRFSWNYQEAALQLRGYFESTYDYSEDSLDEFCYWVVAQGEDVYRDLLDKCETSAVANMNSELQYQSDPGIHSAARQAFRHKTNEEIPPKDDNQFY